MSMSSDRQTCEACFLVYPGDWRRCHSFATWRKVGIADAPACCSFSARLVADGSSSLRAAAHRSRASANPTFGYGPRLSVFSLPFTRYLPRQSLPPAGVTTRYKPSRSNSLRCLAAGLAFLISWIVSIWGYFLVRGVLYPQIYPRKGCEGGIRRDTPRDGSGKRIRLIQIRKKRH